MSAQRNKRNRIPGMGAGREIFNIPVIARKKKEVVRFIGKMRCGGYEAFKCFNALNSGIEISGMPGPVGQEMLEKGEVVFLCGSHQVFGGFLRCDQVALVPACVHGPPGDVMGDGLARQKFSIAAHPAQCRHRHNGCDRLAARWNLSWIDIPVAVREGAALSDVL